MRVESLLSSSNTMLYYVTIRVIEPSALLYKVDNKWARQVRPVSLDFVAQDCFFYYEYLYKSQDATRQELLCWRLYFTWKLFDETVFYFDDVMFVYKNNHFLIKTVTL